jgi:hypothetical protein
MILKKRPLVELPATFVPSSGELRYVAGSPAPSWTSLASELGLKDVWKDLIEFNFPNVAHEQSLDDKCRAVNWLLETRVGCSQSKDGKNYSFEGASPGFIYVPKKAVPPKPKGPPKPPKGGPKPPPFDYSPILRYLPPDALAAKQLAPATIVPFPLPSEDYVRRRLAAAVRVARYAQLGLAMLAAKDNREELWNGTPDAWGLGAWWFGEYSERKFEKVLSTFTEIQWYLADERLKVVGKSGKSGYASALPGIRKITLGAMWVSPPFKDPMEDEAERVQTFVHEAAHIAGRVFAGEGKHYGRDAAHGLADDGMKATRSADNFGYYAIDFALGRHYPKAQ